MTLHSVLEVLRRAGQTGLTRRQLRRRLPAGSEAQLDAALLLLRRKGTAELAHEMRGEVWRAA